MDICGKYLHLMPKDKREEIRITNPPIKLYNRMLKICDKSKRTLPKQAELMLEEYIKEHPELLK